MENSIMEQVRSEGAWIKHIQSIHDKPSHVKTTFWVSDQVQYKPACTVTEASQRLEISDLRRRGIVLSVSRLLHS